MYKSGDFVMYGPRVGYVIEEDSTNPMWESASYKIYFFDVKRTVYLDGSTLRPMTEEEHKDLVHMAHTWCECGAKYVPNHEHSPWCITAKIERKEFVPKEALSG